MMKLLISKILLNIDGCIWFLKYKKNIFLQQHTLSGFDAKGSLWLQCVFLLESLPAELGRETLSTLKGF